MTNLKKWILFLFDSLRVALPTFYDIYLKFKIFITKENSIGVYVKICNPSEIRLWFKNCVAGGYTGFTLIKIFAQSNCGDYEECAEEILNHEILHQVLNKVVGLEAKMALDNIHKSFYVYDCQKKKWQFVVKFVYENKITKTPTII